MDKKYLQDLWNWSNGQDPTLQERYTFEDWTNKLQSEGQYRQKFYDWIGTVDPTHSERRPYQSWEGMVAGVAQPTSKKKEESASQQPQEVISSATREMGSQQPLVYFQDLVRRADSAISQGKRSEYRQLKSEIENLYKQSGDVLNTEETKAEIDKLNQRYSNIFKEQEPIRFLDPAVEEKVPFKDTPKKQLDELAKKGATDVEYTPEERKVLMDIELNIKPNVDYDGIDTQVQEELSDYSRRQVRTKRGMISAPYVDNSAQESINMAIDELVDAGKELTDQSILQRAAEIRTQQVKNAKEYNAIENYYEGASIVGKTEGQKEKQATLEAIKEKRKAHLVNFENKVNEIDDLALGLEEFNKISQKRALTKEEKTDYLDTFNKYTRLHKDLVENYENIENDTRMVGDFESELDAFKRNHTYITSGGAKATAALARIGAGLSGFAGMTRAAVYDLMGDEEAFEKAEVFVEKGEDINAWADSLLDGVSKSQQLDDAETVGDYAEWAGGMIVENTPQILINVLTGGKAIPFLSASAAGEKYMELYGDDAYSNAQKYLASILVGGGTALSESIELAAFKKLWPSKRVAKAAVNKVGRKEFEKAMSRGVKKSMKDRLKAAGTAVAGVNQEGVSELADQFFRNFTNKYVLDQDVSLADGLGDAYLSGAVVGAGLGAAPHVFSGVVRPFVNDPNGDILKNINKIQKLKESLLDADEKLKPVLQDRINQLTQQNEDLIQKAVKGLDNLSPKGIKDGIRIYEDIVETRKEYQTVKNDESMSEDVKEATIDAIQSRYNELVEKRKQLINKANAVQEQSPDEVPVQPDATVSEEVEGGVPETESEVTTEEGKEEEITPEQYVKDLKETKDSDPEGYWTVSEVTEEDAKDGTIVGDKDGAAVVGKDGDIKGLFKKATSKAKGVADKLLQMAIEKGGIKLDNFDGYLSKIYERNGFRVVARLPFDEKQAPDGWTEAQGRPDVVAMVYDPNNELDIDEKTFDDYDEAMAYRNSYVEKAKELQEKRAAVQQGARPTIEGKGLRANIEKAIAKVFPKRGTKTFKNGKEMADYAKKKYNKEVGEGESARVFIGKDGSVEVLVNEELADDTSFGHEVWHAILDKAFGDDQALFSRFREGIGKTLRSNGYEDIADELDAFVAQYAEDEFPHEEYLAQLGGLLTAGMIDVKNLTPQEKSLIEQIKELLNNFAIEITGQPIFAEEATPENVLDFMSTMSEMMAMGEDISVFVNPTKTDKKGNLPKPTTRAQKSLKDKNKEIEKNTKEKVSKGSNVSTRVTSKGTPHKTDNLIVSTDVILEEAKTDKNAKAFTLKLAGFLAAYPNVNIDPNSVDTIEKAEEVFNKLKDSVKNNLKWLYDQFSDEVRTITKLWYDGANIVSNEIADQYGYTTDQVAGVMAVLSPQMDWFRNLSLGKRVIDIYSSKKQSKMDSKMEDYIREAGTVSKDGKKKFLFEGPAQKLTEKSIDLLLDEMRGKTFEEMSIPEKAFFVRAYDEVYNSRDYENISPTGEINGFVMTSKGERAKVGWGGFGPIMKSISILENGKIENISENLGNQHKVRNFFVNISNPNDTNAVTIDTHAVAAALLKPLAGSDSEVVTNLSGPPKSKPAGLVGSYPVFADAYRELANELGILPRELQSITWEAVRGLYKASFKTSKNKKAINDIWERYRNKELTENQVYEEINDKTGGVSKPVWYEYVAEGDVKTNEENSAAVDQGKLSDDYRGDGPGPDTSETEVKTSAQKTIEEANEDFGIEDGEANFKSRAQKVNAKEVRDLSDQLNNTPASKLESIKKLINKGSLVPNKTQKAYKLFKVKKGFPGELFPLFVGANESVTTGDWIDAKAGELKPDPKTGRQMVKSTLGPLAYRPGWHAGDSPMATHIGSKANKSDKKPTFRSPDHVWAEVEVSNDVDWQKVANERAEYTKDGKMKPSTAQITDQLPMGGFYRYKTNSNMTGNWIISGNMKVNRVLTEQEVESINKKMGTKDLPRQEAFDYDAYGFGKDGLPLNKDKVVSNQIARAYIVAKETGDNPELVKEVENLGVKTRAQKSKKPSVKSRIMLGIKGTLSTEDKKNLVASIKAQARATKGLVRSQKEVKANIKEALNELFKKGTLTTRQMQAVLNRFANIDLMNNDSVVDFVEYMEKVFENAEKRVSTEEKKGLLALIKGQSRATKILMSAQKAITEEIKELQAKGNISTKQMVAVLRRLQQVDLSNPESVTKFVDYMARVFKDAEYYERVSSINRKRKAARKGAETKAGIADALLPLLQKVFSVDARVIPANVLDAYESLVNQFSERAVVLTLGDIDALTEQAKDVLNSIETELERAEALAEIFDNYENKILDDEGKVQFAQTINDMVDNGSITAEDAEIMKKYKSTILGPKETDKRSEEEIEEERQEKIEQIKSFKEVFFSLPTLDERNVARKLFELIKTSAIEKLDLKDLNNLLKVIDNIENGFLPHYAQIINEKMEAINNGDNLANAVDNANLLPVEKAYAKIKALVSKGGATSKAIARNPLFFIDELFGNFKSTPIFKSIFEPVSRAFSVYQSEINTINDRMDVALKAISKSYGRNPNKVQKSKQKMMAYLLQKEFQANPNSKEVNSAKAFLDETIKYIEENEEQNNYSDRDLQNLKELRDTLFASEEVDLEAIFNTFNSAEKNAINTIDKINEKLSPKVSFTSTIIRGRKVGAINQYVHHNALVEKSTADKVTDLNVADVFNRSMMPSTKAKSLEERTGKATPLVFDPFSSTQRGARYLLMDYYLTEPIRTARRSLKHAERQVKGKKKRIVKAIEGALEQALSNTLVNTYTDTTALEDAISYIEKTGYRAMLASIPRAVAELSSNLAYVALYDPNSFFSGINNYKGVMMSEEGLNVMKNLRSQQIERLYPASQLSGRLIDSQVMSQAAGIKSGKSLNAVTNAASIIYNYSGKQVKNFAETTADFLISTPDKMIMKPLWFGAFASEFKKQTGQDVDFGKLSKNDEVYMTKYKQALEAATAKADESSVRVGASDNPFTGILKGASTPNQSAMKQFFNKFNNFMTRFLIYEYSTARTGVYALMGNGSISRKQGGAILGATMARMITYSFLSTEMIDVFMSLLGFDDDEEDEDTLLQKVGQATGSALTGLLLGRNFGNLVKAPINIGVEEINKEFLDFLREGEYDPYKNSLQYTIIPKDERKKGQAIEYIKGFSGAFGPAISTAARTIEVAARSPKTPDAVERRMKELTTRTPLEILGNTGYIPLYKDVRRIMMHELYKDMKKAKSSRKRSSTGKPKPIVLGD